MKMDTIPEDLKYYVETEDGPICGYIDRSELEIQYKFKSIPYAKPPLGNLRFLPPSPIKPWTQVLDCTKDSPLPTSFGPEEQDIPRTEVPINGSEDCLYNEVWTPSMHPKEPMPVMFWIGSYVFAFSVGDIIDASPINEQNVVFVKCGFRLGPFGFLSINDYPAPGNCGLKDIVLALKWVQRNIHVFGGDPNNVTIFGSSSGGAIVHLMMLSPMAAGLFQKAIIQSASALNNWSLAKNPTQRVLELATQLGIKATSLPEIVEELRNTPRDAIMVAFCKMLVKQDEATIKDVFEAIFKPCIEIDHEGQPAFITKSPHNIMKSGNFNKVPIIIGSNNVEGALLQFTVKDFYSDYEKYNKNVSLLVPKSLARDEKFSKKIGQKLLKFYLDGEEHLRADTRTQYLQLISDYYFSYYVNKTVRLHSQVAPECPIYYYIINYVGEWSVPKKLEFLNSDGHSSELPLLFLLKTPDLCKGSRDSVTTRKRVVKLWTNFAKTGTPTPDEDDPLLQITWDPVESSSKLNYLNIGSELTKGRNPFQERMNFWDSLHQEHVFLKALIYFSDIGVSW